MQGPATVLPYLQEPRDVPLVVDPHGHHVLKHPEEGALLARLGPGVVEQVVELEEKPPGPFCTGGSGSAGWRPAAAPQGRLRRGRGGRRAWVETAFGRWPPRSAAQSGATKDRSEMCGPGSEHPRGTRPSGRSSLTVQRLPGRADEGQVVTGAPTDHQVKGTPLLDLRGWTDPVRGQQVGDPPRVASQRAPQALTFLLVMFRTSCT